jgi:hypothetical protein
MTAVLAKLPPIIETTTDSPSIETTTATPKNSHDTICPIRPGSSKTSRNTERIFLGLTHFVPMLTFV